MEERKSCRATHAYVNPITFVTLKINARTVVGTEFRFSLTMAMIRSPTQSTGNVYNAICSRCGWMWPCGSLEMMLTQNILCDARFSGCVRLERSVHAHLESMGFAGRDGCWFIIQACLFSSRI